MSREAFEIEAARLGYVLDKHPIHDDLYLFSVTNDAYRLWRAAQKKYAGSESEAVAWKHSCAALLTDGVELWVNSCPHCGKPRPPAQPQVPDEIEKALKQAFNLGMAYWQQADSESYSENRRSDATRQKFNELLARFAVSQDNHHE